MDKIIERKNWRLVIENVVKNERKKKDNGKGNHGQPTPDDTDTRKIILKRQFDPSLVTGLPLFVILNSHICTLRIMTFLLLCQLVCCSQRQKWRMPNFILFQ